MKKAPFLLLAAFAPAAVFGALTPEPAVAPVEMFGASVDLKPGLKVGISQDSNFYTESAGREDSTDIYTLNPSLSARVGDDNEFTEFLMSATGGWVSANGADDYTDYRAAYAGKYAPAGNLQVTATVGASQGHDERGTGNSDNCTDDPIVGLVQTALLSPCGAEPNTFQDTNGNFAVTLGSPESSGRVTLGLDAFGRRYTNNGASTGTLEYDSLGGLFKFAWKVGGKTDAVFETKLTNYDYLVGGSTPDNSEMEYLLGVEWDVSGKTSGYAKAGLQEKEFDDPTKAKLSDPAWRVGVTWLPTEQGMINLDLSKSIQESSVAGTDAKAVTVWNVRGQHRFNDRVEPYINVSLETTDYQGSVTSRTDDANTIGLGVDYKFRRWVVLGVSWTRRDESADAGFGLLDFERDVIALSADLTL